MDKEYALQPWRIMMYGAGVRGLRLEIWGGGTPAHIGELEKWTKCPVPLKEIMTAFSIQGIEPLIQCSPALAYTTRPTTKLWK